MKANINIPDNLNEITLWDYQNFLKIEEPTNVDVLKTFLHLTDRVVNSMQKVQVDSIANHIIALFEEKQNLTSIFNYNGKEYGFIPSLDDISWGENADVTKYISDWDNMHLAMSVLYRPTIHNRKGKYLIEEYKGIEKGMELMPVGIAMGAVVFFYHLTNDLLNYIPNYLANQLEKKGLASEKNGDSITNSILLVKETSQNLRNLADYHYINATFTLPLSLTKQKKK